MFIITNTPVCDIVQFFIYYIMLQDNKIEKLYIALGDRIRAQRETNKLSQTEFSKHIGISRSSLVNIEKGRQRTPLHMIYSIAEILDIDVISLLPRSVELERTSDLTDDEIREKVDFEIQDSESIDRLRQFLNKTNLDYE